LEACAAAEGAATKAEDAEKAVVDHAIDEEDDGWYNTAEDAPPLGQQAALLASFEIMHQEANQECGLAEVNAAIEARVAELSCATSEHEPACRAYRQAIGDLIAWRADLVAVAEAHRLL
jgi:hypothetical protein